MKRILSIIFVVLTYSSLFSQSDTVNLQTDSLYFRETDLKRLSLNYFNLSRPNKFNFEVIVIGGVKSPGIYLIPEGTSLVEVVALTGGATDESIYENVKLIRSKIKNPELRADTVYTLNYKEFFEKDYTEKIQKKNPLLKPGDIISFPIKPDRDFWQIATGIAGVIVLPVLSMLTVLLNVMIYNK